MALNRAICERFDKILVTMLKQTSTADECVKLINFTNNAKHIETLQLKVIQIITTFN
jgi:hypothetical protein